jgi:hypothetical protein
MTPTPVPADPLAGLHDVVVPEPVSFLPATPAWLAVLALLLAAFAWLAFRAWRRWRRNRYRREAAAVLRSIESRLGSAATREEALAELPVLVKRVALQLVRREEVAALSGTPWLEFLDRTWEESAFSSGPGRLLPKIAYGTPERRAAVSRADVDELVALLRQWIPRHRAPSIPERESPPGERAA